MTKSSRDRVKAIMAPVMMPGRISGSSTLKKAPIGVQPKSMAASGRDLSICRSLGRICKIT